MKNKSINEIKTDIKTIEKIQEKVLLINSAKLDELSAYFRDVFSIVEFEIATVIENNTEFKYYKEAYRDAFDRLRLYDWTSYWVPCDQRDLLHKIKTYVNTEEIMGIKRMDGGSQCFGGLENSTHMKSHYECLTVALNCLENINNKVEKGKRNDK